MYLYFTITFFWSIDQMLSLKLIFLQIILLFYFYLRVQFNKISINELEIFFIKIGKFYIIGSLIFYFLGAYEFSVNPVVDKVFYLGFKIYCLD